LDKFFFFKGGGQGDAQAAAVNRILSGFSGNKLSLNHFLRFYPIIFASGAVKAVSRAKNDPIGHLSPEFSNTPLDAGGNAIFNS
jgi:hypothetical protein